MNYIAMYAYVATYIELLLKFTNKCDQAWENRCYLHVKCDLILRVKNVITFYL